MTALLLQLTSFLHEALPLIIAATGFIFAAVVHRKNQELAKAHVELADRVDDIAVAQANQNISSLEAKVNADDEKRIQLESAPALTNPVVSEPE